MMDESLKILPDISLMPRDATPRHGRQREGGGIVKGAEKCIDLGGVRAYDKDWGATESPQFLNGASRFQGKLLKQKFRIPSLSTNSP